MRKLLAIVFLASLSFAQTTPKPQPPSAPKPGANTATETKKTEVPPSTPVITIPGVCEGKQATGAACKTVVTREQFEKLANALSVPENRRTELANAYAQMLVVGGAAEQRGIANTPDTQEVLKFVRLQTLARLLAQSVQQEAAKVPEADVQKYYDEHKDQFTQATLQRIFIPKNAPTEKEKPDEAAVKAEATKIEAASKAPDADFAKLQKQVYDDLKISSTPPPTDLKDIRRDNVPAPQQKVFDLGTGGVSDPADEPGGIYIYKLVSKSTPSLKDVEPEIKRTLEQQRFQADMEKLLAASKPELNQAYFATGAEGAPAPPTTGSTVSTPPASKAPATAPKASAKTPK